MNIFVSGGASGLGEAIVRRLAQDEENRVWFSYCSSAERAKQFEQDYENVTAIQCDFMDDDSLAALVENIPGMGLDALVNNALPGLVKNHFHKIQASDIAASFAGNILPVIQLTQAAIRGFRKRKFGKIVTVLSADVVNRPSTGWSIYTAEKQYMHSLAKSWAVENANFKIVSNCVSPAFMQTELTSDLDERIVESMIASHPLKALLAPEEVAESVAYLLQASQQVNGVNLVINSAVDIL